MAEFTLKKIEETLQIFTELGGWRIDITGGEPLMREDINSIVDMSVNKFKLKTELVTNSILLNRKRILKFKEMGLKQVAISLDGSAYAIHKKSGA